MYWNAQDFPLKSAVLHLMHLPTNTHIDLSYLNNFPLPSLTPCVNLHRLDITGLKYDSLYGEEEDDVDIQ